MSMHEPTFIDNSSSLTHVKPQFFRFSPIVFRVSERVIDSKNYIHRGSPLGGSLHAISLSVVVWTGSRKTHLLSSAFNEI